MNRVSNKSWLIIFVSIIFFPYVISIGVLIKEFLFECNNCGVKLIIIYQTLPYVLQGTLLIYSIKKRSKYYKHQLWLFLLVSILLISFDFYTYPGETQIEVYGLKFYALKFWFDPFSIINLVFFVIKDFISPLLVVALIIMSTPKLKR